MNWICALKWSLILIAWSVSLLVALSVSFTVGWNRATRRHWKMMERAGSKITRGDF